MICDGYNEHGELNGDLFVYRPLKRQDRWSVVQELDRLPNWLADRMERKVVESRIVFAEWECAVADFDDETYRQLWELTFGIGRTEQEKADEQNLSDGVYLLSRYPWHAGRTCEWCKAWWWNPATGQLARQSGEPVERPPDMQLLCEVGTCPRGHHSSPVQLSAKNELAWKHYQACQAAGFPDDPIVRRNAEIIRRAIRRARADSAGDGGAGRRSEREHHARADGSRRRRRGRIARR